jgi:uncharacterized protein (TIGR03435 family)
MPEAPEVRIRFDVNPKFLRARETSLHDLITKAFGVQDYELSGVADWMTSERYDIDATSGKAVEHTQMMAMLRDMLANRFHLVVHHETREGPVFALVVDKDGPKLPPPCSSEEDRWSYQKSENQATFPIGTSVQDLVRRVNSTTGYSALNKLVVDRTGLQGLHCIRLTYDVEPDPNEEGLQLYKIDFRSALKKLGLRLEPAKAPIDFLVIDGAARPQFDK